MRYRQREERGWRLHVLENDEVRVEVLAERGATITSLRDLRTGVDVLWRPRWGLPHRDRVDFAGSGEAVAMGRYPGGWNTLFPNAGAATVEHGVEWPMHGEVWMTPLDVEVGDGELAASGVLVRSPFAFERRIRLDGRAVVVSETATNLASEPVDAVWNQHPAFGAPLLGADARVVSSARTVHSDIADPSLEPGRERSEWPTLLVPGGRNISLDRPSPPEDGSSRRAFLGDFPTGRAMVGVRNVGLGLEARVEWDPAGFPYAWYWLEAGGRAGFPWYGAEYVLGLEPCTSFPTGGLSRIRELTGTHLTFAPRASLQREVAIVLDSVGS
jgi:Galactose mutarotase and related enzymes